MECHFFGRGDIVRQYAFHPYAALEPPASEDRGAAQMVKRVCRINVPMKHRILVSSFLHPLKPHVSETFSLHPVLSAKKCFSEKIKSTPTGQYWCNKQVRAMKIFIKL